MAGNTDSATGQKHIYIQKMQQKCGRHSISLHNIKVAALIHYILFYWVSFIQSLAKKNKENRGKS